MHGPPEEEGSGQPTSGPPRVYSDIATGSGLPVEGQRPEDRKDHVIWVPLELLFQPARDPTSEYPGESAYIEGYCFGEGDTVTIAVTSGADRGVDLVDTVWSGLRRKGVAVRHLTVLNDRGRIVSLMTLRLDAAHQLMELLRALLVVPVRSKDGIAEVHLLATQGELDQVAERLEGNAGAPQHPYVVELPPARQTGPLQPEDWAFLGLLSAVGALDGPEGPSPRLVAETLGVDVAAFAERASAVEHGMDGLVTGLFAPSEDPSAPWAVDPPPDASAGSTEGAR